MFVSLTQFSVFRASLLPAEARGHRGGGGGRRDPGLSGERSVTQFVFGKIKLCRSCEK